MIEQMCVRARVRVCACARWCLRVCVCVRLLVRVCARVRAVCVRAVCVVWFPAARRGSNKFLIAITVKRQPGFHSSIPIWIFHSLGLSFCTECQLTVDTCRCVCTCQ